MKTTLCFVDVETTGLDPRIHQPYEVCWWREDQPEPRTGRLAHELTNADTTALQIGGYWEREMYLPGRPFVEAAALVRDLHGVTLVGSNPAFDAAMLTRFIGAPVWHHRLINVAEGGMWVFGWDRPKGLADVANECRARGYEIPEPDHTAEGDVRTTRAVYEALRGLSTPSQVAAQGHEHDAAGCMDCECWSSPGNSLPCTCPTPTPTTHEAAPVAETRTET